MSAAAPLFTALVKAPSMSDAACIGRWHDFDPEAAGEHPTAVAQRHTAALRLCDQCRARARCEAWFESLPKTQRPHGVIAGRIYPPAAGRPRKDQAS